jgi:prepilin signal peptidase PulO-like enzyme (type II secretory pathway)
MIALPILAGLLIGMLVNLCADAVSRDRSSAAEQHTERPVRLSLGAPACANCGRRRSPLAWSGLVALLTGRRRCPSCAVPLPLRHALAEAAMILVLALIWTPLGARTQANAAIANVLYSLYGAILLLILVTDLEHRLVPHVIVLPAIALAVLAAFVNPDWDSPVRALLGGVIGLLFGLSCYGGGILFARMLSRARGQTVEEVAFGFGDVTLITFIGLIVGIPDVLMALAIGVFSGGIAALLLLLLRRLGPKRYTLVTTIPYTPFLILGGTAMLVFGPQIMAWYLRGT